MYKNLFYSYTRITILFVYQQKIMYDFMYFYFIICLKKSAVYSQWLPETAKTSDPQPDSNLENVSWQTETIAQHYKRLMISGYFSAYIMHLDINQV